MVANWRCPNNSLTAPISALLLSIAVAKEWRNTWGLFFFTEVQVNDSAYEYQNKDNFLVLKLNPITGKVVYLAMEDDEDDE